MDRKGFLERIIVIGGGALVAPTALLQSCKVEPRVWTDLSATDFDLLNAIGETIIPKTVDLPGAKEMAIGNYIVEVVNACLAPEDQNTLLLGLGTMDAKSILNFGKPFEQLKDKDKVAVLSEFQEEAIAFAETQEGVLEPEIHFFSLLKELVTTGYFSSKEVMTQGFNYAPIPGKYLGCVDFNPIEDKVYKG